MKLYLLLGFVGSINTVHSLQQNSNKGFFSIEGMTGDSMYSGSPGTDRYSGSDSRYESRGRPYEEAPAEQNGQRRQDAGFQNQNQGGFNIPFPSDFSFSEFGSPFGNPEEFQQLLSGFRNGANSAPSDFSQQAQPQFEAPNFGQINQRRSSEESRRPAQSTFKRETIKNTRPNGQVARQLDRFAEDFVRPRPVYVPTPAPYQPRTTTYNYGRYEAETEPERTFRQPVYKPEYRPEYNEPSYPQQQYNEPSYQPAEREYKKPAYTSAFKTTKKPTKLAQKKPTQGFIKPFASEDFNFDAQKFDIQKEVSQPNERNTPNYYAEEKKYETAPESSGFFNHDNNLKNHKLDNNKPTEEKYNNYQDDFYAGNNPALEQGSFFADKPDPNFFTGSESQQPSVDTYTPPESYAPTQSFIQPPEVFSTTENNAASFFQNPEAQGPFKNQEFYGPTPAAAPSGYNSKRQTETSGYTPQRQTETSGYTAQNPLTIYKNSRLKTDIKGSFQPPKLVERFNTPVVKPSLPFQPPEAIEVKEQHDHQEQHEFNGSPVTVERFPAEPVDRFPTAERFPAEPVDRFPTAERFPAEPVDRFPTAERFPAEPVDRFPTAERFPAEPVDRFPTAERFPAETVDRFPTAERFPAEPVERFSSEPIVPSYSPPQAAIPPYSPQQTKPTKGKKPVNAPKKPHVPEHKYEQKNYRSPVVNPGSSGEDHPIMRVKPGQAGLQPGQPQPPPEYRNNDKPAEFRSIDKPSQGYRRMDAKPVMHHHEKNSGHMEMMEEAKARQLPDYDDTQEIITAFTDFKKASSHSVNSGKETFNVNVHASFSPSLNPEEVRRSARGAIPPSPMNRRGGPRIHNIRMKTKPNSVPSHINNIKKKQRFVRRN